jgi:hypothetical protein
MFEPGGQSGGVITALLANLTSATFLSNSFDVLKTREALRSLQHAIAAISSCPPHLSALGSILPEEFGTLEQYQGRPILKGLLP